MSIWISLDGFINVYWEWMALWINIDEHNDWLWATVGCRRLNKGMVEDAGLDNFIIMNITYWNNARDVYFAWFSLLLLAVDDLDIAEGEVVQAVLVVVTHHSTVIDRRIP